MAPPRSRTPAPPPPPGKRRHVGWVWEIDDAPRETAESKLREAQRLAEALAVREIMNARLGVAKGEDGKAAPAASTIAGAAASAMERRSERAQMKLLLSAKYKEDGDLEDGRRTRGKRAREASNRRGENEKPSKKSKRSTRVESDSDLSSILSDREDETRASSDPPISAATTLAPPDEPLAAPRTFSAIPPSPVTAIAQTTARTQITQVGTALYNDKGDIVPESTEKGKARQGVADEGREECRKSVERAQDIEQPVGVQDATTELPTSKVRSGKRRGKDKKKRRTAGQTGPTEADPVPSVPEAGSEPGQTQDDAAKKDWKTTASSAAKEQWDAIRKANPALKSRAPTRPFGPRSRPRPDPIVLAPHNGPLCFPGQSRSAEIAGPTSSTPHEVSTRHKAPPLSATAARLNTKAYKQVPLGTYKRTFSLASLSGDDSGTDIEPPTASTSQTQLTREIRLEGQSRPMSTESGREGSAGGKMGKINLPKLLKQAREQSHTDEAQTYGEGPDVRGRLIASSDELKKSLDAHHAARLVTQSLRGPRSSDAPPAGQATSAGGSVALPLGVGESDPRAGEAPTYLGTVKSDGPRSTGGLGVPAQKVQRQAQLLPARKVPARRRDYAKAANRFFQPAREREVGLAAMMARPDRRLSQSGVATVEKARQSSKGSEANTQPIASGSPNRSQASQEPGGQNGYSDTARSPPNGMSDTDSVNQREHYYCPRQGCTKLYQQRAGLKYHLAKGHCQYRARDSFAHPCLNPGCNKTFNSAGGLRNHLEKDQCRHSGSSQKSSSPPQATPEIPIAPVREPRLRPDRPPPNLKQLFTNVNRRPRSPSPPPAESPSMSPSPSPPPRRIAASAPRRQYTPPSPDAVPSYPAYPVPRHLYPPPQQYYPSHPIPQQYYPPQQYHHQMAQPEPEERSYLLSRFMEAAEPEPQPWYPPGYGFQGYPPPPQYPQPAWGW